MIRRHLFAPAAALAALAALPAHAADDVKLRLDWVNSGYHAVWYYAKDQGVFSNHGINLDIREGRGSMTTSQTVGNKSDEFGTADGGAMMVLRSKGLNVKMVAGYLRTGPSATLFAADKGWKDWKDLSGARVADSAGGSTIYLFKAVQKATGIEGIKDVLVEPAAKPTVLLERRVDAVNSFGFLQKPILESKGMPTEYFNFASAGVNVPGLALLAHDDMIAGNKDLVRRMVTATQEALKLVQEEPEAAIDVLVKLSPNLDRAVHLEILKASFELFDSANSKGKPLGWIPPEDINVAQDILVEHDQIKEPLPIDSYFTNEFVPDGKS